MKGKKVKTVENQLNNEAAVAEPAESETVVTPETATPVKKAEKPAKKVKTAVKEKTEKNDTVAKPAESETVVTPETATPVKKAEKPAKAEKPVKAEKPAKTEKSAGEKGFLQYVGENLRAFGKLLLKWLKKAAAAVGSFFVPDETSGVRVGFSLRYKILLSFLVPVIFIIIVGVLSYNKAEDGMTQKYQESTLETIKMAAEHVDLVSSYTKSEAIKYARDNEINSLCRGSYDDDNIQWKKANDVTGNSLLASQGSNSYIKHVHLITNSTARVKMFSTKSNNVPGILEEYRQVMTDPKNENNIINWVDNHEMLDKALNFVDVDDYFMSYQVLSDTKTFICAIDISTEAMQNFIDGIDLGNGSLLGLISMNGREIYHESVAEGAAPQYIASEIKLHEKDYYKNIYSDIQKKIDEDKDAACEGISEIEFNGEKCLFFYAPAKISGSMVCAVVPVSTVVAQASSIRTLTVILVILALIVVIAIGIVITNSIQKNMKSVSAGLNEVAKGDLTVDVNVRGNDEFRRLAGATNDMVRNTKQLVSKVDAAAGGLAESADDVKKASNLLGACSDDISDAINDITKGMQRQSKHADECVETTKCLSDEIRNVSQQVEQVKLIIAETDNMLAESVKLIRQLGEKATDTTVATDKVENAVKALNAETKKINSFVGVIKKISSQTRLLALNASIEAARAGEAGKGFGVVADQIRKLANDSSDAAGEINKLVDGINIHAESSSKSTKTAHIIVTEQFKLVNRSVEIFKSMQESIEKLSEGLGNIDTATNAADTRRVEAIAAVRDIADIISANSDNAQTVLDVATQLKMNIDNLDRTAKRLGDSMDEMKSEVSVFKL